jgi:hypothetical protein
LRAPAVFLLAIACHCHNQSVGQSSGPHGLAGGTFVLTPDSGGPAVSLKGSSPTRPLPADVIVEGYAGEPPPYRPGRPQQWSKRPR